MLLELVKRLERRQIGYFLFFNCRSFIRDCDCAAKHLGFRYLPSRREAFNLANRFHIEAVG